MSSLPLSELKVGDLVKVSEVYRVLEASEEVRPLLLDETSDHATRWVINDTTRFELLHRPTVKPSVGDIIDADAVLKTMWKRGTILQNCQREDFVFILTADGVWINQQGNQFGFDIFEHSTSKYKVIHLG